MPKEPEQIPFIGLICCPKNRKKNSGCYGKISYFVPLRLVFNIRGLYNFAFTNDQSASAKCGIIKNNDTAFRRGAEPIILIQVNSNNTGHPHWHWNDEVKWTVWWDIFLRDKPQARWVVTHFCHTANENISAQCRQFEVLTVPICWQDQNRYDDDGDDNNDDEDDDDEEDERDEADSSGDDEFLV